MNKTFRDWQNDKCHILGTVKDNAYDLIVYKFWNKYKNRWSYNVTSVWEIEQMEKAHSEKNLKK